MTAPTRSSCTWLATIAGLFLVTNVVAQGGVGGFTLEASRDTFLVLAGLFIAVGLGLRRLVNASMWAPREKAFARRTQRLTRASRPGRTR